MPPGDIINSNYLLKNFYDSVKNIVFQKILENKIKIDEHRVEAIIIEVIEQRVEEFLGDGQNDPDNLPDSEGYDEMLDYENQKNYFKMFFASSRAEVVEDIMQYIDSEIRIIWD
ncbi:MAG TPA: hypothetical protein PKW98_12140 [Candidatus Wallbacteria bacterium]|nr:MAG: hypothetical protein BWY32_00289 [bacterium ADurb.Bin243]HOD39808.1 hypothetical protein [Candidatus Wallbacteria bacterium]HPG58557.1 hypothetical protein [Candidatus Wallbacteria bacterium]